MARFSYYQHSVVFDAEPGIEPPDVFADMESVISDRVADDYDVTIRRLLPDGGVDPDDNPVMFFCVTGWFEGRQSKDDFFSEPALDRRVTRRIHCRLLGRRSNGTITRWSSALTCLKEILNLELIAEFAQCGRVCVMSHYPSVTLLRISHSRLLSISESFKWLGLVLLVGVTKGERY
jgi:hypothetical protein